VRWSDGGIARFLTLRKISRAAYDFSSQELRIPLPYLRTLERWPSRIPATPGFQPAAHVLFNQLSNTGTELQRIGVLALDEMKVSAKPTYSN
jgi:hypothetical protein